MHELTLCRSLLQQVTQIAEKHHAIEIKIINLKIGPLAGIEIDLLQQAFPLVAQGTLAQEARLIITSINATIFCNRCNSTSDTAINHLICDQCGNPETQLISGNEMMLENIVLEQNEASRMHHVH